MYKYNAVFANPTGFCVFYDNAVLSLIEGSDKRRKDFGVKMLGLGFLQFENQCKCLVRLWAFEWQLNKITHFLKIFNYLKWKKNLSISKSTSAKSECHSLFDWAATLCAVSFYLTKEKYWTFIFHYIHPSIHIHWAEYLSIYFLFLVE